MDRDIVSESLYFESVAGTLTPGLTAGAGTPGHSLGKKEDIMHGT